MKKVTIYEVAKEAHVSLATVSRVINGSNVVKEDTKKRVEEAITKLGYRPNAIAQGLALSRTTTVGLILPSTSVSFFSRVINGLCDVAKIYDYNVFLHTITEGVTDIKEIIDEVIKSRVDGVIIYADKDLDDSLKLLEEYKKNPESVLVSLYSTTLADALAQSKDKYAIGITPGLRQEVRLKLNPEPVIKKNADTAKEVK